jgi:hypothetical protein
LKAETGRGYFFDSVLLRVQEIDFAGMVAISAGGEFLQPCPKKASEPVQEKFRTDITVVCSTINFDSGTTRS